jgi:Cu2+-containing amine oxidase
MFTTKSLWVTPYQEEQMYPAGYYVFQSSRDSGLAVWSKEVPGLRVLRFRCWVGLGFRVVGCAFRVIRVLVGFKECFLRDWFGEGRK